MQISQAQNAAAGTALMASCNGTGDHCKQWGDYSTSVDLLQSQENEMVGYEYRGDRVLGIVVSIFFGIILIVGLVGNALVVLVVLCNRQMRSTTNILIMNLAVADLLFIVVCVPSRGCYYVLSYWPFGDAWCRIVEYLVIVCASASIYTLVLMSLDRFLGVVYPLRSMSIRRPANGFRCILLTWTIILVACVPVLFSHGMVIVDNLHSFCNYFTPYAGYNVAAFGVSLCMLDFVVPLALIFALYALMLKRLWLAVPPGGSVTAGCTRAKRRVTKMVFVVALVFAVCWCPVHVVLFLKSVGLYGKRMDTPHVVMQIASQVIAYTNSCVNPFLYAFLSDSFRKGFCNVFSCFRKTSSDIAHAYNARRATSRVLNAVNGKELVNEEIVLEMD
ncbi:hypothetical protein V5799_006490 [Amblyomma americanum]|uniref:G-protein coupled receptors family 1 profile domain-containing protein n=1 Tax=Amblyomma americanum TaxID=6943 RepID=A0AAQ4DW89_AMBAM